MYMYIHSAGYIFHQWKRWADFNPHHFYFTVKWKGLGTYYCL